MLFNIPLIGLFKAVRFESYSFHMCQFYSEKLQFQVASRALAVGSWKESFLTADFADVRGFWLGQLQIPSFQSSTGVVQFVFLGSVLRLTSINKVINSK